MDLCSSNHEKICYNSKRCPVCDLKEEVAEFEKENSELKVRIEEIENNDPNADAKLDAQMSRL